MKQHDLDNVESTMAMKELEHMTKLHLSQNSTALKYKTMAARKIAHISHHLASRENEMGELREVVRELKGSAILVV